MPTDNLPPPNNWPTYWFAALERAVTEGDWQAAARAQSQLVRLGVVVIYRPLQSHQDGIPADK